MRAQILVPLVLAALFLCAWTSSPALSADPPANSSSPSGRGAGRAEEGRGLLEELRTVAPDVYREHMLKIADQLADMARNSTVSADSQKYQDLSYRFAAAVKGGEPPSERTVRGGPDDSGHKGRQGGGHRRSGGSFF